MEKNKKGENLLKLFLSKKMKQIISKKDLNKLEEVPGSKLSKDSTIFSKMSNFPLNLNLNEKKEEKEDKKEKKERKEKKEKKEKEEKKLTEEKAEKEENQINIYNRVKSVKTLKRKKTMINRSITSLCGLTTLKGQLTNISELVVQQEPDISEILFSCCCQQANNYHVYGRELNGNLNYIYKLREFSGACNRFFCPVNCREFTMKMKLISDKKNKGDKDFRNSLMTIQKDFKIPCLCLIRPNMVIDLTKEKKRIGKVEQNFSLFDPTFTVYNEDDEEVKYIEADCCQWGFIFRNYSFGKGDDCQFLIYNSKEKIKPIGHIVKKTESVYSLGDSYHIVFPPKIPAEEKILLTIVAVLIDYQYYEKNNEVIK